MSSGRFRSESKSASSFGSRIFPEKIVVLTAEERHRPGTREIIFSIQRVWDALAARRRRDIVLERVDGPLGWRFLSALLQADLVVSTGFTATGVLLKVAREKLGLRIPAFIHTHGEASSGGGAKIEEMERLLTRDDLLLCASRAESRSFRACFPNVHTAVFPFPVLALRPPPVVRARTPAPEGSERRLVYAGRISEQKNLHGLLLSLWALERAHPRLRWRMDIYGKPDVGYGSPSMGFAMKDYGGYLKSLARRLGLADRVYWKGFRTPSRLRAEIVRTPHIFVSPSLSLEEDFGVAALDSLAAGWPAVLSDWGGHRDFSDNFRGQVLTVPVRDLPMGPHSSPELWARALARAVVGMPLRFPLSREALAPYTLEGSVSSLDRLLASLPGRWTGAPIGRTSVSRRIGRRRVGRWDTVPGRQFRRPARTLAFWFPRTFRDHADPLAKPFFRSYGLRAAAKRRLQEKASLFLVPWASLRAGEIAVADPHRGCRRWRVPLRAAGGQGRIAVRSCVGRGGLHWVPRELAERMMRSGLILTLPAEPDPARTE